MPPWIGLLRHVTGTRKWTSKQGPLYDYCRKGWIKKESIAYKVLSDINSSSWLKEDLKYLYFKYYDSAFLFPVLCVLKEYSVFLFDTFALRETFTKKLCHLTVHSEF